MVLEELLQLRLTRGRVVDKRLKHRDVVLYTTDVAIHREKPTLLPLIPRAIVQESFDSTAGLQCWSHTISPVLVRDQETKPIQLSQQPPTIIPHRTRDCTKSRIKLGQRLKVHRSLIGGEPAQFVTNETDVTPRDDQNHRQRLPLPPVIHCTRIRLRIPAMPITDSDLMAITIPSDADHRRSEATLGCSYHAEVIGIRQALCC